MYFNVYSDTGQEILGYLIPDGFSTKPWILVRCEGRELGPIECDIFLEGPYKHKHHETGVVGFRLHEGNVPGVSGTVDIEISDAQSGFTFYRRFAPERHIQKRVFRLETQFVPHRELDRSLYRHFQFYGDSVERYGSETVRQMLEIVNQSSTYVSGRVTLKNVQRYLTEDIIRITSLRDPFYELAIRLWAVAAYKKKRFSFVSERDSIIFQPAMSYFENTNFSNLDELIKKVRSAPKEVLTLFESPFTHQLVAANPTERVTRDGVSAALDALSQFALFDPNENDNSFATNIVELLGLEEATLSFSATRSPFLELSQTLRNIKTLELVLENDLILFHFIRKAEERVRSGP